MLHSSHFQRHDIFRVIRYFQTLIFQCSVAKIFIEPGPAFHTRLHVHPAKTLISLRIRTLGPWLPTEYRAPKTLIKLRGCAGWSVSSLGAHVIL